MPERDSIAHVEYRPIPGFSAYRVGSDGSVWTCRIRTGRSPKGQIVWGRSSEWKRLSVHLTKTGRVRCELVDDEGVTQKHFIHRLVLLAFVGPQPSGLECCHGDGNPGNNAASNLRWGTHAENSRDKVLHGTEKFGEQLQWTKLTEADVIAIRSRAEQGAKLIDLAHDFRVTPENISCIVKRKTWRHI